MGLLFDFFDSLKNLWNDVVEMVTSSLEALEMFVNEIDSNIIYFENLTNQVNNGVTDPVNFVEILSNFRFLVGDLVYYYIFMLILIGILFSIWRLVVNIFVFFTSFAGAKSPLATIGNWAGLK